MTVYDVSNNPTVEEGENIMQSVNNNKGAWSTGLKPTVFYKVMQVNSESEAEGVGEGTGGDGETQTDEDEHSRYDYKDPVIQLLHRSYMHARTVEDSWGWWNTDGRGWAQSVWLQGPGHSTTAPTEFKDPVIQLLNLRHSLSFSLPNILFTLFRVLLPTPRRRPVFVTLVLVNHGNCLYQKWKKVSHTNNNTRSIARIHVTRHFLCPRGKKRKHVFCHLK